MSVLTCPMQAGTVLANVRYAFTVAGVQGTTQTTGITQPDNRFAFFRISCTLPTDVENVVIFDNTDATNYNVLNPDIS